MVDVKWIEVKMQAVEREIDNSCRELKMIEEELAKGVTVRRMQQLYKDYMFFRELNDKQERELAIYKSILK